MARNYLALDTATTIASVSLLRQDGLVGERLCSGRSEHARSLVPAIQELLAEAGLTAAHLDGFAVGVGPGSFTGLRIGLATVKGLARSLDRPVVGVSSLAAVAQSGTGPLVCSLFDARKSEVYAGLFRRTEQGVDTLLPEATYTPASLAAALTGHEGTIELLGDGLRVCAPLFTEILSGRTRVGEQDRWTPRGAALFALARARLEAGQGDPPGALAPNYCRLCEAELARRARLGIPPAE